MPGYRKVTLGMLLSFVVGSVIYQWLGQEYVGLSMLAMLVFLIVWLAIIPGKHETTDREVQPQKPPRDWTPEIHAIQTVFVIVVVAVIIGVAAFGIMYASQIPTSTSVWQQSMVVLGLDPNTPKPTGLSAHAQMEQLVNDALQPDFPEKANLAGNIVEALLRNDLKTVEMKNAEAGRDYLAFKVKQGNQILDEKVKKSENLITIQDQSILLVIIVTLICAVINIWLKFDIPMVGKITGQFIIVSAIIGLAIWLMPPETQKALHDIYVTGMTIKFVPLVATALALIIGVAREEFHTGNKYFGFLAAVGFAIVLSMLGLGFDSLFQLRVLTDTVVSSRGLITLNDAYLAWQLGSLAGVGVTSVFSTGLLLIQAYYGVPKSMRDSGNAPGTIVGTIP